MRLLLPLCDHPHPATPDAGSHRDISASQPLFRVRVPCAACRVSAIARVSVSMFAGVQIKEGRAIVT